MNFVQIPEHRFEDVILHLRLNFFADEPLNKSVNLCKPGKGHGELEYHSLATLKDGYSVMAVTEDNQIAGVALNGILKPGDTERALENISQSNDERFKSIFKLLYEQNLKNNLFDEFNVEKIFDLRILSVDSTYRGQGIATKLIHKSEDVAREHDFKILKGDATGLFSQKILTSLGFKVLSEIRYDTYEKDGENPMRHVEPPHETLKIMYKLID